MAPRLAAVELNENHFLMLLSTKAAEWLHASVERKKEREKMLNVLIVSLDGLLDDPELLIRGTRFLARSEIVHCLGDNTFP